MTVLSGLACLVIGGVTAFHTERPNGDLEWPEWLNSGTHAVAPNGDLEWPEWLQTTPVSPK
jgi:hypothetical protein